MNITILAYILTTIIGCLDNNSASYVEYYRSCNVKFTVTELAYGHFDLYVSLYDKIGKWIKTEYYCELGTKDAIDKTLLKKALFEVKDLALKI